MADGEEPQLKTNPIHFTCLLVSFDFHHSQHSWVVPFLLTQKAAFFSALFCVNWYVGSGAAATMKDET